MRRRRREKKEGGGEGKDRGKGREGERRERSRKRGGREPEYMEGKRGIYRRKETKGCRQTEKREMEARNEGKKKRERDSGMVGGKEAKR